MSDVICVTNRHLIAECEGGPEREAAGGARGKNAFLVRIDEIARCRPAAILLREKDLPEADYEALARQVMEICKNYDVPCILHTYAAVAGRLGAAALQLPMPEFRRLLSGNDCTSEEIPRVAGTYLPATGVSVHSPEEAVEAERLGASWLIAGHIFDTECKEGLPGRRLHFLRRVCEDVRIPVLAIGGITAGNAAEVRSAGAAGICVMSGVMRCADVDEYLRSFE